MADRERLEAQLRANWSPQNLSVYADFLSDHGDPRGELIALDLRFPESTPELRAQQDRLLATWGIPEPHRGLGRTGFAPVIAHDRLDALDTPLGDVVRRVELDGARAELADQLRHVGRATRPWLETVLLRFTDAAPAALDDGVAALVACAPHLHRVDSFVGWATGWGQSRTLTSLRLDFGAFVALARSTEWLPYVTRVTTRLPPTFARTEQPTLVAPSLLAQLPALRRLDLGDGETSFAARDHVLRWLAGSELVRHLDELVVPAPRSADDVSLLERIRARFAGKLVVRRAYSLFPFVVDGSTVPPFRPWPPFDVVHGDDPQYRVRLRFSVEVGAMHFPMLETFYVVLVDELDERAEEGADFARWDALFAALGAPPRACTLSLPTALATTEMLATTRDPSLRALYKGLRDVPPALRANAIVRIDVVPLVR